MSIPLGSISILSHVNTSYMSISTYICIRCCVCFWIISGLISWQRKLNFLVCSLFVKSRCNIAWTISKDFWVDYFSISSTIAFNIYQVSYTRYIISIIIMKPTRFILFALATEFITCRWITTCLQIVEILLAKAWISFVLVEPWWKFKQGYRKAFNNKRETKKFHSMIIVLVVAINTGGHVKSTLVMEQKTS